MAYRTFTTRSSRDVRGSGERPGPYVTLRVAGPRTEGNDGDGAVEEEVEFLYDTGASITSISEELAARLGLQRAEPSTAVVENAYNETTEVNVYTAYVRETAAPGAPVHAIPVVALGKNLLGTDVGEYSGLTKDLFFLACGPEFVAMCQWEGKQPLPCRGDFWVWLPERMPANDWQKLMNRMTEAQRVEVGTAS